MRHYLTACRGYQLPVLLESMRRHCGDFRLQVLAWDFDPHDWECLGPDVEVTPIGAFLRRNPRWTTMPGPPRQTIDQVATARWRFLADVMRDTGEPVTMIDGDQWFWASPEPVYAEIGEAGIAVSPHRFPAAADGLPGVTIESHGKFGVWNTGWVHFAPRALPIVEELAELNWQWSYTEVVPLPDGRFKFGDQSALEDTVRRWSNDGDNAQRIGIKEEGDGCSTEDKGIQHVEGNDRSLRESENEGLSQIWSHGYQGMQAVEEIVRKIPDRHGKGADESSFDRSDRLQWSLQSEQLPMGNDEAAASKCITRRDGEPERREYVSEGCVRETRPEISDGSSSIGARLATSGSDDAGGGTARKASCGCHIVRNPGVNLAPWNIHRHRLDNEGGVPRIDGLPVVTFHYSSMKFDAAGNVTQWADPGYAITEEQRRILYEPYADAVRRGR